MYFIQVTVALLLFKGCLLSDPAEADPNDIEFDLTSAETPDPSILDPGRYLNITPPDAPEEYPSFISVPVKSLHGSLFTSVFNLLLRKGLRFHKGETKLASCFEFKSPEKLESIIDLELGESGTSHQRLLEILELVLDNSPQVAHPYYLSRELGPGLNPAAVIGDFLASTLTNLVLTFYAAPVFTLMELEVTKKLNDLIGYQGGDGITVPGSNYANLLALQLAIRSKFPESKFVGLQNFTVAIFISEEADVTTWIKVASFEGVSVNSVRKIKTTKNGRMDPVHLRTQIQFAIASGFTPLLVVGSVGTGPFGTIDPIDEITNVTREFEGLWLHIDASVGAPILFSDKQRGQIAGVERSDSFTWSSSALLGVPHTSAFLLTKSPGILAQTFSFGAKYVFLKSALYNHSFDTGDKTVQSARRPDMVKTWFLWKTLGRQGIATHVDSIYKLKDTFQELIMNSTSFELALEEFDCPIVVAFRYIPKNLAKIQMEPAEFEAKLNWVEDILLQIDFEVIQRQYALCVTLYNFNAVLQKIVHRLKNKVGKDVALCN